MFDGLLEHHHAPGAAAAREAARAARSRRAVGAAYFAILEAADPSGAALVAAQRATLPAWPRRSRARDGAETASRAHLPGPEQRDLPPLPASCTSQLATSLRGPWRDARRASR